jgi:hypothetical protein
MMPPTPHRGAETTSGDSLVTGFAAEISSMHERARIEQFIAFPSLTVTLEGAGRTIEASGSKSRPLVQRFHDK